MTMTYSRNFLFISDGPILIDDLRKDWYEKCRENEELKQQLTQHKLYHKDNFVNETNNHTKEGRIEHVLHCLSILLEGKNIECDSSKIENTSNNIFSTNNNNRKTVTLDHTTNNIIDTNNKNNSNNNTTTNNNKH